MRFNRLALLALASATALVACPREQAPERDRLLEKLEAEQRRLDEAKARAPEDPNADLARLAAAGAEEEGRRKLPSGNATFHLGPVAFKLAALSTSHSALGGGRVSLATAELFLKVTLAAQNVGAAPAKLDLSFARVVASGQECPIASDAQRVAGTRELSRVFAVGERSEVVLFFEVPRGSMGKGLALVFPAAISGAEDVRVPLE